MLLPQRPVVYNVIFNYCKEADIGNFLGVTFLGYCITEYSKKNIFICKITIPAARNLIPANQIALRHQRSTNAHQI